MEIEEPLGKNNEINQGIKESRNTSQKEKELLGIHLILAVSILLKSQACLEESGNSARSVAGKGNAALKAHLGKSDSLYRITPTNLNGKTSNLLDPLGRNSASAAHLVDGATEVDLKERQRRASQTRVKGLEGSKETHEHRVHVASISRIFPCTRVTT